jgi:hypothetical protein
MKKPTGKPGVLQDRILQCIDIKHCIQAGANAAILGVELVECSHSHYDGSSNYSDVIKEEGVGANDAANAVKDGSPFTSIEFNDGRSDKVGEEDEEVAVANIAMNVVIPGEGAEGAVEVRPCPPSLPAFSLAGCPMQQPQLFCLLVARRVLAEICNQH